METVHWYAARTQPRHEKKVLARFQANDSQAFLPSYFSPRRWRNGLKVNLELPLFPGYIFVRTSLAHRTRVLSVPGVLGLVGSGSRPAPIPDHDIDVLATRITKLSPEPHPFIRMGDRVRIRTGPLAGLEGVLIQKKDNFRFVLAMDLIMRAVSVEVDCADIEGFTQRNSMSES